MALEERIEFSVNGQRVSLVVDPRRPLLRVLREDLGLIGTKQACDLEGECGACTVIVDGEALRSCLLPVGKVSGRSVTTVEGLGTQESPHPLQTAFLELGAVQCGYCTPGVLMSAKALLDRNGGPTRDDIVRALDGNLCRCTGYVKIIEAVERAASRLTARVVPSPGRTEAPQPGFVGGDLRRYDGWDKVSGAARYAEDIILPEMHHVKVVRSPHWHARVVAIDPAPALALDGVVMVLTGADVPGENGLGYYSSHEHLLAAVGDRVRMVGDAVALVVGRTLAAAEAGAAAVNVDYEVLPHTLTIEQAEEPGAIQIHAGGNVLASDDLITGDAEAALDRSAAVVDEHYETTFQAHGALEREAAVGYLDEAGRLTVICASHEPHWSRGNLAIILGLPEESLRVITPPIGGSFGGKQDIWTMGATALALYHLRKPVRLAFTRAEVMEALSKRHPQQMRVRLGATDSGQLTGLFFDARLNTGAYDSAGLWMAGYGVTASVGAYRWQGVSSHSKVLYSNATKAGQMRGFGSPQPVFAVECAMDELCQRLAIDPLALRLQNAVLDDENTGLGYPSIETMGYHQCLEAVADDYQRAQAQAAEFNARHSDGRRRRAVGLAGMWYRFGKFGRRLSQAEAELDLDGTVIVYCSSPDYGQGVETVFSQLAAQHLGLPRAAIRIVNADTALTLDGDVPGASRTTYWVGGAVADAARRLQGAILGAAAEMLDCLETELIISSDGSEVLTSGGSGVTLSAVAAELQRSGQGRRIRGAMDLSDRFPGDANSTYLPMFVTGAQVAEVEVDRATGESVVLRVSAAHDIGKAINPQGVEGQIEGSIMMALGQALMEEFIPGASTGFSNYYLPTMRSTPEIRVHLVEVTGRYGPMGVKGLGEAALLPTAPAIVNAISRAAGARIRQIPATSERVLAAIHAVSTAAGHGGRES